jgi:Icc-related predicted phosphoesterase
MKFVLISDTHCQLEKMIIPDGDILIHAGDLTYRGSVEQTSAELRKLSLLTERFKQVIVIDGNHDWLGEKNPSLMESLCKDNGLTYLKDSSVTIDGINIYGSPFQPEFCSWAFNLPRGEALQKVWAKIPDDTHVLVTHGPPRGILDLCPDKFRAGCDDLLKRINELEQLKLHVFGHIHLSYGQLKVGDVTFVNASICDEGYYPVNKPIVFDIPETK